MAAAVRKFKAVLPAATNKAVHELTVVTYNVLADKYVSSGHHSYCPREHLHWSARMPRLLDEITSYKADILCLQEVERPFMEDELGPKLHSLGHEWLYYGKQRKPSDLVSGPEEGVCLSYNTSRLEKVASIKIRFSDYATKTFLRPLAARVKLTPPFEKSLSSFLDLLQEKEDGAIVALLRDTQANKLLIATSTHIFWDPRYPDIKAAQATLLCAAIREYLETQSTTNPTTTLPRTTDNSTDNKNDNSTDNRTNTSKDNSTANAELVVTKRFKRHDASTVPVIIGGDFNSLPQKRSSDAFDEVPNGGNLVSGVYTIMTQGKLESEHQDHPATRRNSSKERKENASGSGGSRGGGGATSSLVNLLEFSSKGFNFTSAAKEAWGCEPLFTNRTPGFTGCLDYIFFSPKSFEISEILEMPFGGGGGVEKKGDKEVEEAKEVIKTFSPIPSADWPSDHLAFGAKLRWKDPE